MNLVTDHVSLRCIHVVSSLHDLCHPGIPDLESFDNRIPMFKLSQTLLLTQDPLSTPSYHGTPWRCKFPSYLLLFSSSFGCVLVSHFVLSDESSHQRFLWSLHSKLFLARQSSVSTRRIRLVLVVTKSPYLWWPTFSVHVVIRLMFECTLTRHQVLPSLRRMDPSRWLLNALLRLWHGILNLVQESHSPTSTDRSILSDTFVSVSSTSPRLKHNPLHSTYIERKRKIKTKTSTLSLEFVPRPLKLFLEGPYISLVKIPSLKQTLI